MDVSITFFSEQSDGSALSPEQRVTGIVSAGLWPVNVKDASNTEVIAVCENEEQLREVLRTNGIL